MTVDRRAVLAGHKLRIRYAAVAEELPHLSSDRKTVT